MAELMSISDANARIEAGKWLHIAGEEAMLRDLRKGNWIGGTIPYFLTHQGGVVDYKRVFVTELPESIFNVKISFVAPDELQRVTEEAPYNGFSLIILPAASSIHAEYALRAEQLPGIFYKPIVGWVSGVHLSLLDTMKPQVVNGKTGEFSDDQLVVLHAQLPNSLIAKVGIINMFQQGRGDSFVFDKTSFMGDACLINGSTGSFYDYARDRNLDMRLPLVADRSGAMINVGFRDLDEAHHTVRFYAPLVRGIEYRQAAAIDDYRSTFEAHNADFEVAPAFSCNCILNFVYGGLEGEQPSSTSGPATFGEIAYVLLNQTMVYLEVLRI
jgi:hypothetical protein